MTPCGAAPGLSAGGDYKSILLLAALVAVWSPGCARGPGPSAERSEGTSKAAAALRRAYEYRDEPAAAYEPRVLDAERVVDEIQGKGGPGGELARSCLSRLRAYQLSTRSIQYNLNAVERGTPGAEAQAKQAYADRREVAGKAEKCINDLDAIH